MSSRTTKNLYNWRKRRNRIQNLWEEKDITPKMLFKSIIREIRESYKYRVLMMVNEYDDYASIATDFITAISRKDYVLFNEYLRLGYWDRHLTNFEMMNEAKEFFGNINTKCFGNEKYIKYSEYFDWITEDEKKKNGL